MHSMKPRAVLLLAVVIPLAGCGSSPSATNSAAQSKRTAAIAFAQCMRSHGVPSFPDPGSNGHGGIEIQSSQRAGSGASTRVNGVAVNGPAFQAAMQTCRSKLPNGGRPGPMSASQRAAMLRFSRCMRTHGVPNFPDPTFSGGSVRIGFGPGSGVDPSSPAFTSAQRACGSMKGGGGFQVADGPPPG